MSKLQQILGISSLALFGFILPLTVAMCTGKLWLGFLIQITVLIFHCTMCAIFIGTDKIMTTSELYGATPRDDE